MVTLGLNSSPPHGTLMPSVRQEKKIGCGLTPSRPPLLPLKRNVIYGRPQEPTVTVHPNLSSRGLLSCMRRTRVDGSETLARFSILYFMIFIRICCLKQKYLTEVTVCPLTLFLVGEAPPSGFSCLTPNALSQRAETF